jgi:hypothetical protein
MRRPVTNLAYVTFVTVLVMAAVFTTDFLLTVFLGYQSTHIAMDNFAYVVTKVTRIGWLPACLGCSANANNVHSSGHFLSCIIINPLQPTGHVMHQLFNIQQLYALPTLYLFCFYLS